MSKRETKPNKRLEEHQRKMGSFLDALDRIDSIVPDNGGDHFLMPYTTRPKLPSKAWKVTDYA